jgi:hypothetical protein
MVTGWQEVNVWRRGEWEEGSGERGTAVATCEV